MKILQISNILIEVNVIFFNHILNMCIVTALYKPLFGAINLFHKCGPR